MDLDDVYTPRSLKSTVSKTSMAKTEFAKLFNNGNYLSKIKGAFVKNENSECRSIQMSEQAK
jgi:hypothetical protein